MTKEELEKEAEEYANNLMFVYETDIVQRVVKERVRLALIDVLEPREKQIAELKKQLYWKEKALSKAKKETKRIAKKINKDRRRLIRRKTELEAQLEREKNLNQCMTDNNEQLRELIEKMKCCSNCKFGYKCSLFSTQIHKENGVEYQTQAKWNKEKEKYCNVGYSGKYECWEIKEKC